MPMREVGATQFIEDSQQLELTPLGEIDTDLLSVDSL